MNAIRSRDRVAQADARSYVWPMRVTPAGLVKTFVTFLFAFLLAQLTGRQSHASMFLRTIAELTLIFVLMWLPGQVLLWKLKLRGLDDEDTFLLSIPTTLFAYAVVFVLLFSVSAPTFLYRALLLPAVAVATGIYLRKLWQQGELHIPASLPLAYLAAACAVFFICAGLAQPWKEMVWNIPAARGLDHMPIDNELQFSTAWVFISSSKPWTMPGWTMGDRPPLLGALTAVFAKAFLFRKLRFFDYTLLGILLNSVYAIPLIHFCRRIFANQRAAMLAAASLMLTPYFFLNSYYTWPKTAGAFFALTALAVFTRRAKGSLYQWPSVRAAVVLGILLGLSAVCHGGALLSIPLVLLLITLFSGGKIQIARLATSTLLTAAVAALVHAPWALYKAAHAEIQTSNLANHYLPMREGTDQTLRLGEWLSKTTLTEQLDARWPQVLTTVRSGDFAGAFRALTTGNITDFDAKRWVWEFFHALTQVGEVRIMLGAPALFALGIVLSVKPLRARLPSAGTFNLPLCASLLVLAAASYLSNVFLKWQDVLPHTLPLLEVMLMTVPLTLAMFALSDVLAALFVLTILQRFLSYVVACTFSRSIPVDLYVFGLFACVFALLWLALRPDAGGATRATATAGS